MKIVSPADAKAELSTYVRKYDDVLGAGCWRLWHTPEWEVPMPRQSPYVIELSKAERGELAARARKYTHHIRSRCPIVRST